MTLNLKATQIKTRAYHSLSRTGMSRCLRQILTSSRPKHTHTDIRYTHSHTKSHHTFFPSKQKLGTFKHTSPPITHVSHMNYLSLAPSEWFNFLTKDFCRFSTHSHERYLDETTSVCQPISPCSSGDKERKSRQAPRLMGGQ